MKVRAITPVLALSLALPVATPVLAAQNDTASDSDIVLAQAETSEETATGEDAGSEETLVATVGDTDITNADLEEALAAMPPQLTQSQPAEALMPLALDQLVLRALVIEDARADGLAESEEVTAIVEETPERTVEEAMLQVYLQQEMEAAVTDEKVQQTYDDVAENSETEVPPLEEVRPQIEQQLQGMRLSELREELAGEYEVVLYDENGEPREPEEAAPAGGETDGAASEPTTGDDAPADEAMSDDSASDDAGSDETMPDDPTDESATEDDETTGAN